jgi:poly(A) polymerase
MVLYAHRMIAQADTLATLQNAHPDVPTLGSSPATIPRSEHKISPSWISPGALKVLHGLQQAGYQTCLVGGGVRDLLLGREPKDFDIATSALPEEVRRVFRRCRLIGRRFRLAHVRFGREVIEVATFRGHYQNGEAQGDVTSDEGRILRDNVYGPIEEDAWRRDFTVNALYYDVGADVVLDYVGGMRDLRSGVLRLIGEPGARYREDPVRMLRALRFAAKLGFQIEEKTARLIAPLAELLSDISSARLYEEVLKLFMGGEALATFELLRHYHVFDKLFPFTEAALAEEPDGFPQVLLTRALANTDTRIAEGKPVTPAFLFAALLWAPLRHRLRAADGSSGGEPLMQALAGELVSEQAAYTGLPRRFSLPMREIWMLQPRLEQRTGRRPLRLLSHPRFRAAYDFLLLRGEAGEVDEELCRWWTEFQQETPEGQEQRLAATTPGKRKSRGRRRRGRAGAQRHEDTT